MDIFIAYDLCEGCGGCADEFPELFVMRDDKAWVTDPSLYDPVRHERVAYLCPFRAITLE